MGFLVLGGKILLWILIFGLIGAGGYALLYQIAKGMAK